MGKVIKENKGITLIALVITIIVLLILAGVSIAMLTGENGILNQANSAKEETDIAEEKEILGLSASAVRIQSDEMKLDLLQNELDKSEGTDNTKVYEDDNDLVVLFKDSNRYYLVDKIGKVTGPVEKADDQYAGDITKNNTKTGEDENSAYIINCIEDLVALSNMVNSGNTMQNKYVILNRTLNFKSLFSYNDSNAKYSYNSTTGMYEKDETSSTTIKELLTTGQGFIPIGKDSTTNYFAGSFNGQGNEIKNLYINNQELENVGLFGYATGTIQKLGMVNPQVTGIKYAGAVSGMLCKGTGLIQYCYNKDGNISAETSAGGIAGGISLPNSDPYTRTSKVYNCYNTGNVTSGSHAGGIVGVARIFFYYKLCI